MNLVIPTPVKSKLHMRLDQLKSKKDLEKQKSILRREMYYWKNKVYDKATRDKIPAGVKIDPDVHSMEETPPDTEDGEHDAYFQVVESDKKKLKRWLHDNKKLRKKINNRNAFAKALAKRRVELKTDQQLNSDEKANLVKRNPALQKILKWRERNEMKIKELIEKRRA